MESSRQLPQLKNAGLNILTEALLAFGDAYWWNGSPENARKAYQTAVDHPAHPSLYRAAVIKNSALELEKESQAWARRGLGEQRPDLRIYALQQLRIKEPEWRYSAYLLARALYNARAWGDALHQLNEAARKMEKIEFVYETRRLRALCLYRLNRWEEARRAFLAAANAAPRGADQREMIDWHERVLWRLKRQLTLEAKARAQYMDRFAADQPVFDLFMKEHPRYFELGQ